MKKLLFLLFIVGCSNSLYRPMPELSRAEALEMKNILRQNFDSYGLFEPGENAYYQQGQYIMALFYHKILTAEDVGQFCDSVELVIDRDRKCFYSRPEAGSRVMSPDDYFGLMAGLYFGQKINSCTKQYIDVLYSWKKSHKLKLASGMIWKPYHDIIFERFHGENSRHFYFWDFFNNLNAENICNKPEKDTSDKLLLMTYTSFMRHEHPTSWLKKWDSYCHRKVDFNRALEIYYGKNYPLGKLLRGIL